MMSTTDFEILCRVTIKIHFISHLIINFIVNLIIILSTVSMYSECERNRLNHGNWGHLSRLCTYVMKYFFNLAKYNIFVFFH